MHTNRSKNALRNMASGLLYRMITVIFPFAIRTIMIKTLGVEYLGLSSLFVSILQVLSLAELGFSSAAVFSMYKPIAENDQEQICALYNFYKIVYRIIGVVVLIIGLFIYFLIPKLINGSYPSDINIYLLYSIYLFNTVISYLMFAYKECLLIAHQRSDISSNISMVVSICMYILQISSLLLFNNYYLYIIFLPLGTVAINLFRSYFVKKKFPHIIAKGILSTETKKDIFKRLAGVFLFKVCSICRNSFDSIIISAFLGLVALANYQNYLCIVSSLAAIVVIFYDSIVAGIGNSIATESKEKNQQDFDLLFFVSNWMAGFCSACLLCLFQPFITLWVGSEYLLSFNIVIIFVVYFYSQQIGNVVFTYRQSTGLWWEDKIRPIIEAVANLLLNIIAVKYFGVAGVLLATIITIVFINIPWSSHILFKHYFKSSVIQYYKKVLMNTIPIVLTCAITYGITMWMPLVGISWFIIKMLFCLITPNIIFVIIYHNTEEFKNMKLLLARFLPYLMKNGK